MTNVPDFSLDQVGKHVRRSLSYDPTLLLIDLSLSLSLFMPIQTAFSQSSFSTVFAIVKWILLWQQSPNPTRLYPVKERHYNNRKCAMKPEMRKYIRLRYDLQLEFLTQFNSLLL